MTETPAQPWRVFLAEDNRADVYLVELALKEEDLPFALHLAKNGEEALRIVSAFGETEPPPDIALVDLNLPRQDGEQVLRSLRNRSCCCRTPIVVMTSSESNRDRAIAAEHQAAFFVKPSDLTGFLQLGRLVKSLCQQRESAAISAS